MDKFTTKDRLKLFVKSIGLGRNKFEDQVGIANGYLSSKSSSVTSDALEKIKEKYPDLNVDWLITGEGDMIIDNSEEDVVVKDQFTNEYSNEKKYYEDRIKDLEDKLKIKDEVIAAKDDLIDALKNKQ